MQFLVIGLDGDDDEAQSRRLAVREQHLALGDEMEADGSRWYGASIRDDDDKMIGSFAVMDFPSRESLDEWLAREPYVIGDVWRDVQVSKCSVRDPWKFNRPREFFEARAEARAEERASKNVSAETSVLSEIAQVMRSLQDEDIVATANTLIKANRIFVAGGGRSGLIARAVAMRLVHIGLKVFVVGETNTPGIAKDDLFWAFSARGTGKGLNAQAQGAKDLGANVLALTTNETSPLAEIADDLVRVPIADGEVVSQQHAGTLFEQSCLIIGDVIAATVQKQLGVSDDEMSTRHFNLY